LFFDTLLFNKKTVHNRARFFPIIEERLKNKSSPSQAAGMIYSGGMLDGLVRSHSNPMAL
jgi:hypothetical protein